MGRLILTCLLFVTGCPQYEEEDFDSCGDGVVAELEGCDDGNLNEHDGCTSDCRVAFPTTIAWQLYPMLTSPPEKCRPGVESIELSIRTASDTNLVETRPCGGPFSSAFGPRPKSVVGRLLDANGAVVATSLPGENVGRDVLLEFYETAGFIHSTWVFRNAAGIKQACPMFTLTLSHRGVVTNIFPGCHDGMGEVYTEPLEPDDYELTLTTSSGTTTRTVTVSPNNAVSEVAFAITL